MGTDLLTQEEHQKLLETLNHIPLDPQSIAYRQCLEKLYERFHTQIKDLFHTISAYEEVAENIRLRQITKDN